MSVGLLTTTSPSRISLFVLGTPPPIPTIKPKRIEGNVDRNWATTATVAAETVPYAPGGRRTITTFRPEISPRIYTVASPGGFESGGWGLLSGAIGSAG